MLTPHKREHSKDTSMTHGLRFGVNYVPSRNWWYSWTDWDRGSIADDLAAIAELGMDHIRAHCLWPVFQPNAGYVSAAALDRLCELLDLARAVGLDVTVTVLNGWLSGFVFQPAWMNSQTTGLPRNLFTDPVVVDAERRLLAAIADRVAAHPNFSGFDLGNELGVMHAFGHKASHAEADAWASDMLAFCERLAPGKFHVNGVDHIHWFGDVGFSRRCLATTGAATALHTWVYFTGALDRYGPRGVGSIHLAEYCIELARAYHAELRRPIWLQEFGCSAEWMPADDIPDFAEQTIRAAASCADLWGVTWWCSHDLPPHLHGFAPLEYDLGLLDRHNRPKPVARRVATLIQELRRTPPTQPARAVALVLPDDLFAQAPAMPDWRFGARFMELIADGLCPAIVLASRRNDQAHLAARNITTLIDL